MVKANKLESFNDLKNPGDFIYTSRIGIEATTGMLFVCPCGCGEFGGISFNVPEAEGLQGPKWEWDKNEENPTVKPSIQKMSGCKWHGFLTNGEFIKC